MESYIRLNIIIHFVIINIIDLLFQFFLTSHFNSNPKFNHKVIFHRIIPYTSFHSVKLLGRLVVIGHLSYLPIYLLRNDNYNTNFLHTRHLLLIHESGSNTRNT